MEHDGPDVYYGRCQGKMLLRIGKLQRRHGTLAVRLTQLQPNAAPACFVRNRWRGPSSVEPRENPIILRYVLPDFSLNRPGQLLTPDQVVKDASWQILEMNNERFTVPELLFTPSDIGMFFASFQASQCDPNQGAE